MGQQVMLKQEVAAVAKLSPLSFPLPMLEPVAAGQQVITGQEAVAVIAAAAAAEFEGNLWMREARPSNPLVAQPG